MIYCALFGPIFCRLFQSVLCTLYSRSPIPESPNKKALHRAFLMWQSAACKPGSVENGHLSRREVANALKRYCGNRAGSPVRSLHLAPDGVYMTAQSPGRRCALAAPFHPYRGLPRRYLSVALALESPPPAVSRHPALRCPDFPHALAGLRPFSRLCHEKHYSVN